MAPFRKGLSHWTEYGGITDKESNWREKSHFDDVASLSHFDDVACFYKLFSYWGNPVNKLLIGPRGVRYWVNLKYRP